MRSLAVALALSLALAPAAFGKATQCKDAHGRFTKCPPPVAAPAAPTGATAKCKDGTYSMSQHHSGTCSHHGGVAQWLK